MDNKKMTLYFAFPDGLITYDCETCRYKYCCIACDDFGFDKEKELPFFLDRYPYLGYFLYPLVNKKEGYGHFCENYSGGCWFLTQDWKCKIEKEFGRRYKPFICKLFPFTALFRVRDVLVVNIHELCPIQLVSKGRDRKGITHREISSEIDNSKKAILLHADEIICREMPGYIDDFVKLETFLRDRSPDFLNINNYIDFAAFQLTVALKFKQNMPLKDRDFKKDILKAKDEVKELVRSLRKFLQIPKGFSFSDRETSRMLVVLTPSLRAKYIRRNCCQPYRKSFKDLPKILLALYLYVLLFRNVHPVTINLMTILQIFSRNFQALSLLSHINQVPYLERSVKRDKTDKTTFKPPFQSFALVEKKLFLYMVTKQRIRHPKNLTLGEIIEEILDNKTGPERLYFLKSIQEFAGILKYRKPHMEVDK